MKNVKSHTLKTNVGITTGNFLSSTKKFKCLIIGGILYVKSLSIFKNPKNHNLNQLIIK